MYVNYFKACHHQVPVKCNISDILKYFERKKTLAVDDNQRNVFNVLHLNTWYQYLVDHTKSYC